MSLYESVYLPVDFLVNDEQLADAFDLLQVQTLGWEGREVVSVVPRTVVVGLMNVGGGSQAWGAGLGGNVAGVHVVVLRLVVQPEDRAAAVPVLEGHVVRTVRLRPGRPDQRSRAPVPALCGTHDAVRLRGLRHVRGAVGPETVGLPEVRDDAGR